MHPAQIFISYRRDDAAGYARAVYDELARRFGAERVFIDVDDIHAGQTFDEVVQRALGQSHVLLVLIGKRWQGEREGQPPRIGEPGDFVRREVATGLAKGMRVIPLLFDGALMPTAAQLPDELRALAGRHALEIGNARFAADVERLVAALRETVGESAPAPRRPGKARRWGLWGQWALAGALLLAGVLAALWQLGLLPSGGAAVTSAQPASRPEINGQWQAEVNYDWPNARLEERFVFAGEAGDLHGSATFLGVARGLLEGRAEPNGLRFTIRSSEMAIGAGNSPGSGAQSLHRYRGRLVGDEIRFVMQTEGGSSPHVPVEFVARRVAPAPPQAGR